MGCLVLAFPSLSPSTHRALSSTCGRRRRDQGTCGGASSCGRDGERSEEGVASSRMMASLKFKTSNQEAVAKLKCQVVDRWCQVGN